MKKQDAVAPPERDPDAPRILYIRCAAVYNDGLFPDAVERELKPFGVRVFKVFRPEEFRKAVAGVVDAVVRAGKPIQ